MNLPTIDIKGKPYTLVKDRILAFSESFADASIITEILTKPEDPLIIVKATVSYRTVDGYRTTFTGHSQATVGDGYINKTAALENAETSAVGRALAMMGIGVIDSVASADEMNKSISASQTQNSVPRSIPNTKVVQRDEEPPIEAYNEAEEMARIMDGEIVVKKGNPTIINKFKNCPHDNFDHKPYDKCYNCYQKQQDSRT